MIARLFEAGTDVFRANINAAVHMSVRGTSRPFRQVARTVAFGVTTDVVGKV